MTRKVGLKNGIWYTSYDEAGSASRGGGGFDPVMARREEWEMSPGGELSFYYSTSQLQSSLSRLPLRVSAHYFYPHAYTQTHAYTSQDSPRSQRKFFISVTYVTDRRHGVV